MFLGEGEDRGEYFRVRFTIKKPFPLMDRVSIIESTNQLEKKYT